MNPFNDLKTAQDRLERAGTNDWYIIPIAVLFAIMATVAFLGADNVIEVVSEVIVKW